MTWSRAPVARAIAQAVAVTCGEAITVFDRPPATINPPAVVVGRPIEVRYSVTAFGVDEAELPVGCVGPVDGEDKVAELVGLVRTAVTDTTLGGIVATAYAAFERNWRQVNIAGLEVLTADVIFTIHM